MTYTKLIRTLSLAALGALAHPSPVWANPLERSTEKLVSKQVDIFVQGQDQKTGVLNQLDVRRGEALNLIVIARTNQGNGVMEVLESNRVIATQRVGTTLESIQVALRGQIGTDIRTLQLRTSGNFHIAFIGLVVDDGRGSQPPQEEERRRERDYEFAGQFEALDVAFTAKSREEIFNTCQSFMARQRVDNIDDLKIFAKRVRVASLLRKDAACATAALNAREVLPRGRDDRALAARFILDANVEALPLQIEDPTRLPRDERFRAEDIADLRGNIQRLVPIIMSSMSLADDLQIDGIAYRTSGFLNGEGVTAVLAGNLRTELGRLRAQGNIEGSPINLYGYDREEIKASCIAYMRGARSALVNVDDLEINGARHRSRGFMNNQEVCTVVATLTR